MSDYMVRGTAADGEIRFFGASTRETAEFAKNAHQLSPIAAAALGRLLTAGAMMGAMMKSEEDRLTLLYEMLSGTVNYSRKGLLEIDRILCKKADFRIPAGSRELVQKDGRFFLAECNNKMLYDRTRASSCAGGRFCVS